MYASKLATVLPLACFKRSNSQGFALVFKLRTSTVRADIHVLKTLGPAVGEIQLDNDKNGSTQPLQ